MSASPQRTDAPPTTLLISGATGFIGARLTSIASERGYQVRTLTRRNWTGAPAIPESQRYLADLRDDIPAAALLGADVIVHCAAYVGDEEKTAYTVNVEAT